jgi:hypothetical protein
MNQQAFVSRAVDEEMKFPSWTATGIGQLKSLATQKTGAKKIAKALKRAPGAQR